MLASFILRFTRLAILVYRIKVKFIPGTIYMFSLQCVHSETRDASLLKSESLLSDYSMVKAEDIVISAIGTLGPLINDGRILQPLHAMSCAGVTEADDIIFGRAKDCWQPNQAKDL